MLRPRSFYRIARQTVRMSWHPVNLYSLATRNRLMVRRPRSLFQQRWNAKRDMRDYFGAHMTEAKFEALWARDPLHSHVYSRPSATQPQLPTNRNADDEHNVQGPSSSPAAYMVPSRDFYQPEINLREFANNTISAPLPPPELLTLAAFERRLDIAVFRACFAPCIFTARKMIASGRVNVNGVTCPVGSYSLQDGDIVTIDPAAIVNLNPELLNGPPSTDAKEVQEGTVESKEGLESISKSEKVENSTYASSFVTEHDFFPLPYQKPWMYIPRYLEVDYELCAFVFLREPGIKPGVSEVPCPYAPATHALMHEYYMSRRTLRGNRVGLRPFSRVKPASLRATSPPPKK